MTHPHISLERIQGYIDIDHEPSRTESGVPPAAWPTSGDVRVEKLSARYSQVSDRRICLACPWLIYCTDRTSGFARNFIPYQIRGTSRNCWENGKWQGACVVSPP